MCCFVGARPASWLDRLFARSAPVHVARTRIYARLREAEQLIVYGMSLTTKSDVAMVLPLPAASAREDAVRFIDRSHDKAFFDTLGHHFAPDFVAPAARHGGFAPQAMAKTLVVHTVGAFEASFVPGLADFDRLDRRFRLPPDLFEKVPAYADYGFAVFKLAPATKAEIHPMAFTFPTRAPQRLFFPTVHVHDGRVHATADFDHELYWPAQDVTPGAASRRSPRRQQAIEDESATRPFSLAAHPEVAPLVDDGAWLRRRTVFGALANADQWID